MLQDTNESLIDQAISNPDAFYPDVNIQDFQEAYRIPGDAPTTLERQLNLALLDCNAKLADWKAALIQAAIDDGTTVPTVLPTENATDYEEAVFARAFALLIPLLPSVVMDERARDAIEEMGRDPVTFTSRSDSRLARITGDSLGVRRLKVAVI